LGHFTPGKAVENRSWSTSFRWPFCIHAGKGMTRDEQFEFHMFLETLGMEPPHFESLDRGGIVGTADLVGVVPHSLSPWFFGPFGFELANVQPVEFIPARGSLGFFRWKLGGGAQ
jgi:hypothetical protein